MREYSRLSDIRKEFEKGDLNLSELVDTYLGRIEDKSDLNIFFETFADEALSKSMGIKSKISKGFESLYNSTVVDRLYSADAIIIGRAKYYDVYYSKAQKVKRLIKNWTDDAFSNFDFTILPTPPHLAFALGSISDDSIAMYLDENEGTK